MSKTTSLGTIVKRIRMERHWKLADMSAACGIPLSTLSKVENDKLTLTYDKLQQLSRSLNIPLAELFVESAPGTESQVFTARRSIATLDAAVRVDTPNYVYHYLCSDLRKRRMIPIYTKITATSVEDFGPLIHHRGEEFVFVIEGAIEVHSDFYAPVTLREGEGVYIDSTMGHAYIAADGFAEATILAVCASGDEDLEKELMAEAENRNPDVAPHDGRGVAAPTAAPTVKRAPRRAGRRKAA